MTSFPLILAGASLRDRLFACLGALVGIALTGWISAAAVGADAAVMIVAPMGASAVLVFAVPASPLAQPWPVVGGNVLSALTGVAAAALVPQPALAAGIAVAAAMLVMSLTRALHPPGGAAALLAVIGGPAVTALGWRYAVVPVMLNAGVLAATGAIFHRFSGHRYPHRAPVVPLAHPEDVDRALADLGETLDVARADIDLLLARVAHHARARKR